MMPACSMSFLLCLVFCSVAVYSRKINDETSVENILREIQNLKTRQSSCDSKVSALETVVTNLQQEVSALRRGQDSTRGNNAVQNNAVEGKQTHYESSFRNRRMVSSGQTAFTVGISVPDLTHLGDHRTVIFDRAITNIGNAYSTNSGIFQAPLKGAYVFTLTLMVVGRHYEYLEIVVDGNRINDILSDASGVDDYMSTTKQWILDLNRGSEVWMRTSASQNHGEIHGTMHSLFSGFLLFEMV